MSVENKHNLNYENEIVSAFAIDYISVLRLDIKNQKIYPFKIYEETTPETLAAIESADYHQVRQTFTDTMVSPKDRAEFDKITDIEYIKTMLSQVHSYSASFLSMAGHYAEVRIIRIDHNDEPTDAIFGYADRDVEKRAEIAREAMAAQQTDMINILASEYQSFYYVDPATGSVDIVQMDDDIKARYSQIFNESFSYEPLFKNFVETGVVPEDYDRVIEAGRLAKVIANLQDKKTYEFNYLNTIDQYWTIRFTKLEDIHESPRHIGFGFVNQDQEIRHELQYENQQKLNEAIIEGYASEYSSSYYVNLTDDTIKSYSHNKEKSDIISSILSQSSSFQKIMSDYAEKIVYAADKEQFLTAVSADNLKIELSSKRSYTTIFRINYGETRHFCEIKFVKLGDEHQSPSELVLGIQDRDIEISQNYVNALLTKDYDAIYMVDLMSQTIRTFMRSETAIGTYYDNADYTKLVKGYGKYVDYQYQKAWSTFEDPSNVQDILADKDRAEYLFRTIKGTWQKGSVQVIERSEGIARIVILSFMNIDDAQARMLELNKTVLEQKRLLEDQHDQLELALEQANAASRSKTNFLSNMSHDIRTPMNAIIGFTALADAHIDNEELVKEYLGKIMTSSNHLLSLINDVLDMSRIESGKMNLDLKPCSLRDLVHDIKNILVGDIKKKDLGFIINTVDVKNEEILCDKLRLNQVILNCMSNSIKFTPAGGTVSLEIKELVSERPDMGMYEFHITDTGIGMSAEFAEHIFEPFEREKTSTVSGIQGTGLGMAIVKNIVDMMNGTITVKTQQNVGTEFIIRIGFKLGKERELESYDLAKLTGMHVLIIDDDYGTCASVSKMLSGIKIRAEWSTSGVSGISKANFAAQTGDPFDAFIVDWMVPDLNGVQIAQQLRTSLGAEVPIIILTSHDWSEIESEATNAGVTGFCSKPLFLSDLIDSLLSKKEIIEPESNPITDNNIDFSGKRILLVEDIDINREIVHALLENTMVDIEEAVNGQEAVDMVKKADSCYYDLVLMDIQMPIMDGYESTKQIRALDSDWTKELPIVAMTANAFDEDVRKAMDSGMNGHIAKPVDISNLFGMLRKYLGK